MCSSDRKPLLDTKKSKEALLKAVEEIKRAETIKNCMISGLILCLLLMTI